MRLSRHQTTHGPRWAADGRLLAEPFDLRELLALPLSDLPGLIEHLRTDQPAAGPLLAPIEDTQEVWASGVTYQRSREARRAESEVADVYDRVYAAQRPELFFKCNGWRVREHGGPVRIRADSAWNVPEPELTLVVNRAGEIAGYTAGNDMSSRSIEGENPLYLPQAKIYNGACALGPAIELCAPHTPADLPVAITIARRGQTAFRGATRTSSMQRRLDELTAFLFRELDFPHGAFLLTGTGIVPPEQFTLERGDRVLITVGELELINEIGE
jgi:2-dehydro-3-deoxy-D-arabinonate dehydratase